MESSVVIFGSWRSQIRALFSQSNMIFSKNPYSNELQDIPVISKNALQLIIRFYKWNSVKTNSTD